jgi:histone deacetylase complex regulatory component SIN3
VKLRVPPEVYESYHDIANKHMRQELSVKQFRGHLESLFKNYPEILEILPSFFSDSGDMTITTQPTKKSHQPDTSKSKLKKQVNAAPSTLSRKADNRSQKQ